MNWDADSKSSTTCREHFRNEWGDNGASFECAAHTQYGKQRQRHITSNNYSLSDAKCNAFLAFSTFIRWLLLQSTFHVCDAFVFFFILMQPSPSLIHRRSLALSLSPAMCILTWISHLIIIIIISQRSWKAVMQSHKWNANAGIPIVKCARNCNQNR